MVKSLYTHIAIVAMSCSWRSENVAGVAEFYFLWVRFHCASIEYRLILAYRTVKVALTNGDLAEGRVLVMTEYFGDYARIDHS